MIYLYAGLGLAMLSGIMAIFEMGLHLLAPHWFHLKQILMRLRLRSKELIGCCFLLWKILMYCPQA